MVELTKVKINLNEKSIELEGPEEFVQKNLDSFKELFSESSKDKNSYTEKLKSKEVVVNPINKLNSNKDKKIRKEFSPKPISFDINENDKKLSLKKFINEIKPQGNPEIVTCISYYLEKYLNLEEFEEGQIYFAYRALSLKEPQNFHQMFLDIKSKKFYLDIGSSLTNWKLAPLGRNFILDKLKANDKSE